MKHFVLIAIIATLFACQRNTHQTGIIDQQSAWLLEKLPIGDTIQGWFNPKMEHYTAKTIVEHSCELEETSSYVHQLDGPRYAYVCESITDPYCFFVSICCDAAVLPAVASKAKLNKDQKLTFKIVQLSNGDKVLLHIE